MIQQTSIEAFQEYMPKLAVRQWMVYATLKQMGEASNTMISKRIGLPINQVTPRIHELREKGVVTLSKKDTCPVTLKTVLFWRCK